MFVLIIFLFISASPIFGQNLNNPNKFTNCPVDRSISLNNCWGTLSHNNGDRYIGEFKNGKRHGLGTYWLADESQYIGNFKNDKKHGEGVLYTSDGKLNKMGVWVNDQFRSQANLNLELYKFNNKSAHFAWLTISDAKKFFEDSFYWTKSNFSPYFSNAYKAYKKNILWDFLLTNWKYTTFLTVCLIFSLRIIRFIAIRLDPYCTRCFADMNHVKTEFIEEKRWIELVDGHTSQEITDRNGYHSGYIKTPAKIESELRSGTEYYHCRECGKKWSTYYPVLGYIGENSHYKYNLE